jgi:hypothetical protein
MIPHCLTIQDGVLGAFGLDKLVLTPASRPLALLHLPLLEAAQGNVFSYEHVEGGVNVLQRIIPDENDGIKSL